MVYSAKYWLFHFGSLKMTLLWTKCECGLYLLYSDILFLLYNTFSSAMLEDFLFWYYWEEVNGGCLEKRGFSCNALTWIPSLDIAHISSLLYDWLFFVPQKWVWFRSCRQTRVMNFKGVFSRHWGEIVGQGWSGSRNRCLCWILSVCYSMMSTQSGWKHTLVVTSLPYVIRFTKTNMIIHTFFSGVFL